jgi:hypothetical protein
MGHYGVRFEMAQARLRCEWNRSGIRCGGGPPGRPSTIGAKATLRLNGREVHGALHLRRRWAACGLSFTGRTSDFRDIDGLLVPHMMVATWVIDGKEMEYARFSVERIEFDVEATS